MDEYIDGVVFGEKRVCTVQKITREQECTHKEAADALEKFYKENTGKEGLWAAYSLSGVKETDDGDVEVVQLVRSAELADQRSLFKEVKAERIFALHTEAVENLSFLMLPDHEEDRTYFRSDASRAPISDKKQVDFFRSKMSETQKNEMESIVKVAVEIAKTSPEAKKPAKKEQKSIQNMFVKAMNKDKTPTKSRESSVRESPFKAVSGDESNSPIFKRRRGPKLIVGSSDEESPEKKRIKREENTEPENVDKGFESEGTEKKEEKKNKEKKKIDKAKNKDNTFANSDLFDSADASPEKVPEPIFEKKERKQNKKEHLKGQTKLSSVTAKDPKKENKDDESDSGVKKVWESVQETYADEDGFMVVRSVMQEREVAVDEEADKKPLKPSNKDATIGEVKATKNTVKKAPVGQSKISSFFGKK